MSGDALKINLNDVREVSVPSREDLVELLRTGEVVVMDKSTGKFLTELMGVPLPPVERVLETVAAKKKGSQAQ